jgi:hypothetical protein
MNAKPKTAKKPEVPEQGGRYPGVKRTTTPFLAHEGQMFGKGDETEPC